MKIRKLKALLLEHNYKYCEMANALKISESNIAAKMNDKREFKPSEISKLRKLLKLTDQEVIEIFID